MAITHETPGHPCTGAPPIGLSVDEVLTTTRNVRRRLDVDRPVPRAVIEQCLDLALQAPNGSNHQSWEWIVVDDPDTRGAVAELCRQGYDHYMDLIATRPHLYDEFDQGRNQRRDQIMSTARYMIDRLHEVPAFVIPTVLGRTDRSNIFVQASAWGSIMPAAWSFMLALRSRGLGSCFTTLHLWREREVAEVLGIPYERYQQAALIPVAYTIGTDFKPAQRTPAAQVMHWNAW